jgi:hypothetical protein
MNGIYEMLKAANFKIAGARVLDIGSGPGAALQLNNQHMLGFHYALPSALSTLSGVAGSSTFSRLQHKPGSWGE